MIDQGRDALNENGTGCRQNTKKLSRGLTN